MCCDELKPSCDMALIDSSMRSIYQKYQKIKKDNQILANEVKLNSFVTTTLKILNIIVINSNCQCHHLVNVYLRCHHNGMCVNKIPTVMKRVIPHSTATGTCIYRFGMQLGNKKFQRHTM